MAQTITEKILARAAGLDAVQPGQIIEAPVDLALANDITAPLAIAAFEEAGFEHVFDPAKVALVPDHFMPNKDVKSAGQAKILREFARKHALVNYFEVGRMGIEHVLLPEQGLVTPGDVIVGADSHTCTYGAVGAFSTGVGSTDFASAMAWGKVWLRVPESFRFVYSGTLPRYVTGKDLILHTIGLIGVDGALYQAMEFTGEAIARLSMEGRFTMCNMAIEAGAKSGVVAPDATTAAYLAGRAKRPGVVFASDADAAYARTLEIDVAKLEPTVAKPHLPANTAPAAALAGTPIDQVVIGSCTNGRLEDLRQAAEILGGRTVHPNVRLIILPGTQQVCLAAAADGTMQALIEAGGAFSTPTCGPCLGGHMGVLAAGERCVSTTNRNFVGRMGDVSSEVYLASPYVAAASAIAGHIATPEMVADQGGRR